MISAISASEAPKAIGPYSQAIVTGKLVFVSGQIPLTPLGHLVGGSIEDQTHQVMKNLKAILEKAGVTFKNVVKTTVYMTDISMFSRMNEVYSSYVKEPFPARETVAVKDLPKGAALEISMVAAKQ